MSKEIKIGSLIENAKKSPGRNNNATMSGMDLPDNIASMLAKSEAAGSDHLQLTTMGATIKGVVNSEQWFGILERVQAIKKAYLWIIADIIWYGLEREYGKAEPEMQRIVSITGLSSKRLSNLATLAHTFEFSRRRENLSIGHHSEVTNLSEDAQEYYLDIAEEQGLSVRDLRALINGENVIAPTPLDTFKRKFSSFSRIQKSIAKDASAEDRKKMARQLRKLANEIVNSK